MIFKYGCLIALLIAIPVQAKDVFSGKVSHVTDGDTLWVQPHDGGRVHKLRLQGMDAPEICQEGGQVSRDILARRALHQEVEVTVSYRDVYGRGIALIRLNGHDLGAEMVRAGHAWSYRWRRNPGPYVAEETLARQARRGLFAQDQPELPGDFRKRHGSCHRPKR